MASPASTHCLHCLTIEAKHSPTVEALSARPPTICAPPPHKPRSQSGRPVGDDERARALVSLARLPLVGLAALGWTDLAFVMLMPKQLHDCTLPILGCTHHHHRHYSPPHNVLFGQYLFLATERSEINTTHPHSSY